MVVLVVVVQTLVVVVVGLHMFLLARRCSAIPLRRLGDLDQGDAQTQDQYCTLVVPGVVQG